MLIQKIPGPQSDEQYVNLVAFDKGGMGEIYLADDTVNGKKVAVKIINLPRAEYEELLMREVEVSRSLSGKNIVSTLHAGKTEFASQNLLYLVQEYYAVGSLRKKVAANIPFDKCFRMMNDILDGIKIIHEKIVHRDLKPENILVGDDDCLLIADFGLAKYVEEETKTKTFKGSGTYPYMAPECWTNEANSIAMDIYAIGIIFFEILAGRLPVTCSTVEEWRDFHLFTQLPDLAAFRSDVPVKLKQMIAKMTEKRVSDRFNNVSEVKKTLEQAYTQSVAEQGELERLAQMAHSTIQQVSAEQLRQRQLAEKEADYQKNLNFHITEVFDNTKRLVDGINSQLESQKIKINETSFNGNVKSRRLELSFNGKSLYFGFSPSSIFSDYEEQRAGQNLNRQRQQYGMVVSSPGKSIFQEKQIVLLGNVYCNHQNPALQACFGFNLLLVKKESQQYGKWFRAQFTDSGLRQGPQRRDFSMREDEFLREFELCFAMHVTEVDYNELSESDLTRAIQEILTR